MQSTRDVFICHASEDKSTVVRPMVEAFNQAGISCWHDEAEIHWGDSITGKVNEGLRISRYVIVVLSPVFLGKKWPQRELNAAMNLEASSGEVRVLPLVVGSSAEKAAIIEEFPLLNDKRCLPWDGDLRAIVEAMKARLGHATGSSTASTPLGSVGLRIPLPEVRKRFTQRDRDVFLRHSFSTIKEYFQQALQELSRQFEEVEADFAEVHTFKIISTIYVHGEMASKCKVWLGGGFGASESIAYQAGQFSIDADNSWNDLVTVSDDGQSLGLRLSAMWTGGRDYTEKGLLTAEQAAEYLWRRFTDRLG